MESTTAKAPLVLVKPHVVEQDPNGNFSYHFRRSDDIPREVMTQIIDTLKLGYKAHRRLDTASLYLHHTTHDAEQDMYWSYTLDGRQNIRAVMSIYLPSPDGSTDVDRYFKSPLHRCLNDSIAGETKTATLGRFVSLNANRSNPEFNLHVLLGQWKLVHAELERNNVTNVTMIAREGLITKLGKIGFDMFKAGDFKISADSFTNSVMSAYPAYWGREPLPGVYHGSVSQMGEAVDRLIRSALLRRYITLGATFQRALRNAMRLVGSF